MRRRTGTTLAAGFVLAAGVTALEVVSLPSSPAVAINSYVARAEAQSLHRTHGIVGATSSNPGGPHGSVIINVHWDRTGLGYRPLDMKVLVVHHQRMGGLVSWWDVPDGGAA